MTRAPETLINEAMTLENAEFLGAPPHERTEDWRGYANGLKPRRMLTRSGRRRSPCAGARRAFALAAKSPSPAHAGDGWGGVLYNVIDLYCTPSWPSPTFVGEGINLLRAP